MLRMEYKVDPTFESNDPTPYISPLVQGKLLIRAVLTKDKGALERLTCNRNSIYSFCVPRSLNVDKTALHYAIANGDLTSIKILMTKRAEEDFGPVPQWLIGKQSTGKESSMMLGHGMKCVTAGRGGKEGNGALLKDRFMYEKAKRLSYNYTPSHMIEAFNAGLTMATLEKMSMLDRNRAPLHFWSTWFPHLVHAVRAGENELASGLIEMAVAKGGFGFNLLHQEVLVCGKYNPLTAFKAEAVFKKATGNSRIMPVHCAAVNPDPHCLSTLLATKKDLNIRDGNDWTPIHYAAVCKGPGPLEYLLGRGASTNVTDRDGNTPLHAAAAAGRLTNAKLILAAEAELAEVTSLTRLNKAGLSPLHVAAKAGRTEVVKLILALPGMDGKKNSQTLSSNDRLTPLMLACQQGHLSTVKGLVEAGCKLEIPDRGGRTALAHAVINGQAHVVSYLLSKKANHLAKDRSGNTLVHYAVAYGWYFVFKVLMAAGCDPNEPNQWKMTPIAIAFLKGHTGLVEVISKEPGVNLNAIIDDKKGMTILHQTCSSKPTNEMITRLKFLVEMQKANCTIPDAQGNNAIHYLVESEGKELDRLRRFKERGWETETKKTTHYQDALRILVTHGCDPKAKNTKRMTPLALGVKLGCFDLVQKLISLGGRVDSESSESVLHYLVEHIPKKDEASTFYKALAKEPASLARLKEMARTTNKAGLTPLLLTLSTHSDLKEEEEIRRVTDFINFLILRLDSDVNAAVGLAGVKGSNDSVLHLALATNYSDRLLPILLTAEKLNLDPLNRKAQTPLVTAILKNNVTGARSLIEAGAHVGFGPEEKSLILLQVSQNTGSFGLIPFLIEKGVGVKGVVDVVTGDSILHFVAKSPGAGGAAEAVRALLSAGIPVDVLNKYERTPLHLAVNARGGDTNASYDVEELLIEAGANKAATDVFGRTPLHLAFVKLNTSHSQGTFMDPIELVSTLTSGMRRADVEKVDDFMQSPLHCAAARGATVSAEHLISLSKGAGRMINRVCNNLPCVPQKGPLLLTSKDLLNALDANGNSALALAVLNGHEGCALMLLQAGADFLIQLNRGVMEESPLPEGWFWKTVTEESEFRDRNQRAVSRISILDEVVRRDWQGLLHLMLKTLKGSGAGLVPGIEAALKVQHLALAARLTDLLKTKEVNTKKQSLLHSLAQEAIDPTEESKELQVRILKRLLSKKADLQAVDALQASPIIYAAAKWNATLSSELSRHMVSPNFNTDYYGRTPFSAIFWNPFSHDLGLPEEMKAWAETLLNDGSGNALCQYPIQEPNVPTVRYVNVDPAAASPLAPKYTPLIMAVIYGNQPIVKWLLSLKGKIDINAPDSLGRTALMHAVKRNDFQMVKLLLSPENYDLARENSKEIRPWPKLTSPVHLNAKDKQGLTVIHHLVAPVPGSAVHYVTAEAILRLLAAVGTVLDSRTGRNETPLELALRLKQYNMAQSLGKLLRVPVTSLIEYEPTPPMEDNVCRIPLQTTQEDSKKLMDRLARERQEVDLDLPVPDPLSGLKENNSEIVIDDLRKVPLDCLLTQTDMGYGVHGLYNFYKMQLIRQTTGPQLILLFTRWGRMGQTGQFQRTPFPTVQEALKEFKKIFRAKTGNGWEERPFVNHPKKYRLLNLERGKARHFMKYSDKLKVDFELLEQAAGAQASKLSLDILALTKHLVREHRTESAIYTKEVAELLPFGLLSRETLGQADALLDKLHALLTQWEVLKEGKDHSKDRETKDAIVKMSQDYYALVPVSGFASKKMKPLFKVRHLRRQQELVKQLLHYEYSSQILLGAQYRAGDLNPFDYVYGALGTKVGVLDPGSEEAQLILGYIHNTSDGTNPIIERIYRVQVPGGEERLDGTGIGNRTFLWHGTRAMHLLSILNKGLQVSPVGAQTSEELLLGKGIYFGDMFAKCAKYASGTESTFMLLCEVALGTEQKIDVQASRYGQSAFKPLKAGASSLKTCNSRFRPLPSANIYWKGRTLKMGPKSDNPLPEGEYFYGLDYNEYIVFNADQVNLRYMVQYRENKAAPAAPLQNLFN